MLTHEVQFHILDGATVQQEAQPVPIANPEGAEAQNIALKAEVKKLRERIPELNAKVNAHADKIDALNKELIAIRAQLKAAQDDLAKYAPPLPEKATRWNVLEVE